MTVDEFLDILQKKYYGKIRTISVTENKLNRTFTLIWRPWVLYSLSLTTGNKTYSSKKKYTVIFTKEVFEDNNEKFRDTIISNYIDPTIEISKGYFVGVNTTYVTVPKGVIE